MVDDEEARAIGKQRIRIRGAFALGNLNEEERT